MTNEKILQQVIAGWKLQEIQYCVCRNDDILLTDNDKDELAAIGQRGGYPHTLAYSDSELEFIERIYREEIETQVEM